MSDTLPVPTLRDLMPSFVRTIVPFLVGWIVAALASVSVVLDDGATQSLNGLVTFLVGSVYYIVVRWLEQRFPRLGWLLGSPKQPTYTERTKDGGESEIEAPPRMPSSTTDDLDALIDEAGAG